MKKGIISSLIATTIMLFGSFQSLITVSANTQASGEITNTKGVVTTNKLANIYALKDNKLVQVTNRALTPDSDWLFNKTMSGDDGLTYYHVATNEWLPSDSVKSNVNNNHPSAPREKTSVTIGRWSSATVNSNGDRTGNILPTNSSWQAFSDVTYINGQKFYQIGSNEYVSDYDLTTSQPAYIAPTYTTDTPINTGTYVGTVVGNKASHIYHLPTQHRYRIGHKNIIYFSSEQEAINKGYHKSKA
ncbi:SLAP domain-containing protein [Companilactobacillus nodensis]|uniref:S-layer protein C-terminal domain-containing protein n=1 Tax=Companilactobacillus nodensis DSM 19682 = JCM 14932 = NBRC 107160 TaxID=1423775 RepID=A0A0R1KK88_9LACO|nr:SLAP domain-containing protein [Companilactobacillus nodensis]KRK80410.1 hypothetical protein FD03_GL001831 [Companilactobacillus nodensis DSM 19682 = JCM 14932 = NBRC 107160]